MDHPLIGLVGVCATGKSTLAAALQDRGYNARQVSQEHSYVRDLWRRMSRVDVLIYLDCSLDTIRRRLHDPEWPEWLLHLQYERLDYSRQHCHLYLPTDDLTPEQVLDRVIRALDGFDITPASPC